MTVVTLYARPGCHLCDQARAMLEGLRSEHDFDLRELNIDDDDQLLRRYLERIPVIAIDGTEALELVIDEVELREHLGKVRLR